MADAAQIDDIEFNFQLNANCTFTIVCWPVLEYMKVFLCLFVVGKKQDVWYVVDLLTGEKKQTLTSSYAEMLCPSSSLLYLGRTGKGQYLSLVLTLCETIYVCVYMSRKTKDNFKSCSASYQNYECCNTVTGEQVFDCINFVQITINDKTFIRIVFIIMVFKALNHKFYCCV